MFLLGLLLGSVIFGVPGLLLGRKLVKISKIMNAGPKYIRRGIYQNSYSVRSSGISSGISTGKVDIQFEIGELESTGELSKVEVISCIPDQSAYNNEKDKKRFTDMVDGMWINSDRVQWITTIASKRNEKIDQVLG